MHSESPREKALEFLRLYGPDALTRVRQERDFDIALGGFDRAPAWDRLYTEILRILSEPHSAPLRAWEPSMA